MAILRSQSGQLQLSVTTFLNVTGYSWPQCVVVEGKIIFVRLKWSKYITVCVASAVTAAAHTNTEQLLL